MSAQTPVPQKGITAPKITARKGRELVKSPLPAVPEACFRHDVKNYGEREK